MSVDHIGIDEINKLCDLYFDASKERRSKREESEAI